MDQMIDAHQQGGKPAVETAYRRKFGEGLTPALHRPPPPDTPESLEMKRRLREAMKEAGIKPLGQEEA